MTDRLVIRLYRDTDHAAVTALNRYGLVAADVPDDADIYAGDLNAITETYLTGRNTLLVGEIAGSVVAMGGLREVDALTCEVLRMRVDPRHQGRGHGRRMLDALEERARQFGYRRVVLITGPDQHPAIDLYQAAGYQEAAVEAHGGLVGVRMVKPLRRPGRPPIAR
jgi:ribosomal protein S18 acetylase RimI-like enzyme